MPRASMTALIDRTRALLGGDTVFTADELQSLLDAYARPFRVLLVPDLPGYTTHRAPFGAIEDGAVVYLASDVLLTGHTIDLARGIVTTPTANDSALYLQGTAHDVYAAAADGWDEIAQRYVADFDFSVDNASYKESQKYQMALRQAERMRARAHPVLA